MAMLLPTTESPSRRELAAQAIAVRIRWFGLVVGYLLVNLTTEGQVQGILNAILALGVGFTLLDTAYSLRERIFLRGAPLVISGMEGLFIGLLCYFDRGLESSFRYYYFLSLICCALRYSPPFTYLTCALHCVSYTTLALVLPHRAEDSAIFALTLVALVWVTWASTALAVLLKQVGDHLAELNDALRRHQLELEERIADRTRELQEAQAHLLQQEKMAAFGLLAAGIAHEVGNPLTSISAIVQILQQRNDDSYTQNKLHLVGGQLLRIQSILRELIEFSRPASNDRTSFSLLEIIEEALSIAKYYKRTGGRIAMPAIPPDLPSLFGVRDQLVQVFLNLILNAIDAVDREGHIDLEVVPAGDAVEVRVHDDGPGIAPEQRARIFQPYFTTKKHGTGLGLFVTRKLVVDHGGTVDFVSTPGQGTTFRVRLPVAPRPVVRAGETLP
jgi:signal transduction histidine kinase